MASIDISAFELGPLSLEVRDERGQKIGRPAFLSSGNRSTVIEDVAPGTYTVIATRPSGDQITQTVVVRGGRAEARLTPDGPSPHEFMSEATSRGMLMSSNLPTFTLATAVGPFVRLAGAAGQNLAALKAFPLTASTTAGLFPRAFDNSVPPSTRIGSLTIVHWQWGDGAWSRLQPDQESLNRSDEYLQIKFAPGATKVRAIGLLDEVGYGPIAIVPPFRQGIDVTFLASGVSTPTQGARIDNPSAVRTPVALAVPRDPVIADLLVALNAPAMQQADALWNDTIRAKHAPDEHALEYLQFKYEDPAAAALGALFLARFQPKRIPVSWLANLARIEPNVADGALLLAWLTMSRGEAANIAPAQIRALVRDAARRPCLMFARTRSMLVQAARLYGPYTRTRKVETETPRHPRPGDFLDFAADAGGLECFWGSSPVRPGTTAIETRSRNWETKLMLLDGQFRY